MIAAILQARVSSTRLPGKVLMPILGAPMLLRQIERVRRAKLIDALLIATSDDASDDPIALLCKKQDVQCFRGSLDDVLDRFYQSARRLLPDHIVRLTGDCPLCDPLLIDQVVEHHLRGCFDYTSNTIEPTYPDGLDVEIFRYCCLEETWHEARLPSQREHVTPFVYQHPERYRIGSVKHDVDLSELRWTVDEPEDLELVRRIYGDMYPNNQAFGTADILDYLDRQPDLKMVNTHYERNEGFQKSLQADTQLTAK
jgi:spore coat polysaccharide biosynthesis protein SpsF